nr:DUF2202 domain-containing protein [Deltaproteobacteria bacterium]
MKAYLIPMIVALGASLSACGDAGNDGNGGNGGNRYDAATYDAAAYDAVTADGSARFADEAALLRWLREEEKLAHDVYVALQGRSMIFSNIAASEQMHTEAVKTLLDRYGIPDPSAGRAAASFADPTLQSLYDALVARGSASTVAALQVGAEVEELDIADIREMRGVATSADVRATLDTLERGSRNHLRSFWRQLQMAGASYTPQHLDAAEFRAIAESAAETGR